jgi:dipeptidase E
LSDALSKHIVALGGGGFSDGGPSSKLDDYILGLARKPRPRICFMPTAGGDADSYVAMFYRAFSPRDCQPSDLALFRRTVVELRPFLLEQDVIYVGGGNTANMLAIWRTHGIDRILREAWEQGIVLAGISAGAICWFEASVTDSFGLGLSGLRDGLGLVSGSACPHYNSEERRRPVYRQLVGSGFPPGYAIDDQVGLHFVDAELAEVVTNAEGRTAYEVKLEGMAVRERPLAPRSLS